MFLREFLKDKKARPSIEIKDAAHKSGVSGTNLKIAMDIFGIKPTKHGKTWEWVIVKPDLEFSVLLW